MLPIVSPSSLLSSVDRNRRVRSVSYFLAVSDNATPSCAPLRTLIVSGKTGNAIRHLDDKSAYRTYGFSGGGQMDEKPVLRTSDEASKLGAPTQSSRRLELILL
jgi:hypothetical protein